MVRVAVVEVPFTFGVVTTLLTVQTPDVAVIVGAVLDVLVAVIWKVVL
jgi:hypothetical protein